MGARLLLGLLVALALGTSGAGAEGALQCRAMPAIDAQDTRNSCDVEPALDSLLQPVQYNMCPYGTGYYCVTFYGTCQLYQPLCIGAPCYCPSVYGPVWGNVN